jgi:hypothetical protein
MKKEIEKIIKEKANNIYEKYYSNNPDIALSEKKTIMQILSTKFALS